MNKILKTKGCIELTRITMLDMKRDIDPELLAQEWLIDKKDLL